MAYNEHYNYCWSISKLLLRPLSINRLKSENILFLFYVSFGCLFIFSDGICFSAYFVFDSKVHANFAFPRDFQNFCAQYLKIFIHHRLYILDKIKADIFKLFTNCFRLYQLINEFICIHMQVYIMSYMRYT